MSWWSRLQLNTGIHATITFLLLGIFLVACEQLAAPVPQMKSNAIKIMVSDEGFYLISSTALRQAGLNFDSFDIDSLRLSTGGITVDYAIEEDQLLFFGQEPPNRYSRSRAYLLEAGTAGAKIKEKSVEVKGEHTLSQLRQVKRFEENRIYDGGSAKEQSKKLGYIDPWYWETLQVQSQLKLEFPLPELVNAPSELRLGLWGVTHDQHTDNDHDFDLYLNGSFVENVRWDGESYFVVKIPLEPGWLVSGSNEVTFDNSVAGSTPVDIMRIDWIEVEYFPGEALSSNQYVPSESNRVFQLSGYSDKPVLFNVSDPVKPVLLTDWGYSDGVVRFASGPEMEIWAVMADGFLAPDEMTLVADGEFKDTKNQADLLILTTEELMAGLTPLIEARISQGLNVVAVDINQIYDHFGYGQPGPEAINNFLRDASRSWQKPRPEYLLIVGDATYDFRDYLSQGNENLIPAPMVPVSFGGETISDSRLADLDGDLIPDMAIGRWPVTSISEVRSLVQRTLAYENQAASAEAIFVADGSAQEFSTLNRSLVDESDLSSAKVTFLEGVTPDEFSHAWKNNPWLVTYSGHGSLDRWGKDDLFSSESINLIRGSAASPITLQLTCLTGYFAHPLRTSLSELMLLNDSGPALIVSATSLTLSSSQKPFGVELLKELQNPDNGRIGLALLSAQQRLDVNSNPILQEIIDTFGLLGDPSATIVRP